MAYIHLTRGKDDGRICDGKSIYYLNNPDKGSYSNNRSFLLLDLTETKSSGKLLKDNIYKKLEKMD